MVSGSSDSHCIPHSGSWLSNSPDPRILTSILSPDLIRGMYELLAGSKIARIEEMSQGIALSGLAEMGRASPYPQKVRLEYAGFEPETSNMIGSGRYPLSHRYFWGGLGFQ